MRRFDETGMTAPRSVMLLIADDWSPIAGCYGHEWIRTPRIDALAGRSTVFDHAFCTTPSSAASTVSISGHMGQTVATGAEAPNSSVGMFDCAKCKRRLPISESVQMSSALWCIKDKQSYTSIQARWSKNPKIKQWWQSR